MPKEIRVLVDTSVLVSGLNSTLGASAWLIFLGPPKGFILLTSDYILNETHQVILRKFPELENKSRNLQTSGTLTLVPEPSAKHLKIAGKLIDDTKDIPVLAAALSGSANYIVTLDQKDFIKPQRIQKATSIKTILPGEALHLFS